MLHFGFSYIGLIYLLLLFIPNIIWSKKQPKDYEKYVVNENKILLVMERTGEMLVCCFALIFSDFNIKQISPWSLWLLFSFLLMILYECYWIRYFKSEKTMADFYSSFCGFPLAGATLPVIAFFLLGIYGKNLLLLIATVILGIGHIGIHYNHSREIAALEKQGRKIMNSCKKKIETIDIVGLGALGVMYADFFTKKLGKERVRVLADADRIRRYREDSVTFNGQVCDFNYLDAAKESRPAELILFAVKYGALDTAMEEVAHLVGKDTILLSVLNGIRSEDDLGRKFGVEKVVHCIAQKMDAMKEKNTATCKNKGELALGVLNGGKEENLTAVKAFFDDIGFTYSCPEDMRHTMWAKLLCNVGVNQTVSLYAGTYRTVQEEGEAREMMKAAMQETILVANAEGVDLSEKDLTDWVAIIDSLNPDGEPSMRQDSKAGRKTEVVLFAGTICELGKKHGIATPVNDNFLEKIK